MDVGNYCKGLVSINIMRSHDHQVSEWSGGTTTQLAIHPQGSEYIERNFEWRISTAMVNSEKSTFTSLPGVHRILMILDGQIEITHDGIRRASLNPFEQDEFEGGWTTHSIGMCTDFNLMMVEGLFKGKLEAVSQQCLDLFEHEVGSKAWEAFYLLSAVNVTIGIQDEVFASDLNKGDFLLISAKNGIPPLTIKFSHNSAIDSPTAIRTTIYK